MPDPFEIIAAERRDGARAALAAAFGPSAIEGLAAIEGGGSGAFTYRAEVRDRSYVLRLEQAARSPLRDPERGYACMRIAAAAGIAPPLHYAEPAAGIAIMDFITDRPLHTHPGGAVGVARELGQMAARLRATPVFPALADFPRIIERLLEVVRESGMFQADVLAPHAEAFARIKDAYRWDGDALVSSHNDPNPSNILYDGERLWLIDWETAYRNDPMADIAMLANEFCRSPGAEDALVQAAVGSDLTRLERARLTLMRHMVQLYYPAMAFSIRIGLPRSAPLDLAAPAHDEFRRAVADGSIAPTSHEAMETLGKIMLAGFLEGVATPEFIEALAIARED